MSGISASPLLYDTVSAACKELLEKYICFIEFQLCDTNGFPIGVCNKLCQKIDQACPVAISSLLNCLPIDGDCTGACDVPCIHGFCDFATDTCVCQQGWQGVDCSEPICPSNCNGHGVCVDVGVCDCDEGWTGPACSIPATNDCGTFGQMMRRKFVGG